MWSVAEASENKLYVYNWSEYIPEEVYQTKLKMKQVLKLSKHHFSSNEEMLAKMVAGGDEQYDIVVASNYVISAMKEQKLIQKLDISKIKNFANLTDAATGMDLTRIMSILCYTWLRLPFSSK